jgi:glycosyltransferase involved in cell wall biosynthesis
MNMSVPKVSVLIPAYNAEKYLGEAIDSLLNQTFTDFECIIIDDCSTDSTWKIIQKYAKKDKRIRPFKNEKNLKLSATLNKGIDLCWAKYIARMDADDWCYPDRLEKQYDVISKNLKIGIVGGSMEVCNENLEKQYIRTYYIQDKDIRANLFKHSPFCHPSIMVRKEAVLDQQYNELLNDAEDYDLYFRIGKNWEFANYEDTVLKYRISSAQVSTKKAKRQQYLTLYIRLKAMVEYGYKASIKDILSSLLQLILIPILPNSVKVALFNLLRQRNS